MEQRKLKRYVRFATGEFIDTQKIEKCQYYDVRTIDGIHNWLCIVDKDYGWCETVSLFWETSDNIWELLKTNDYLKIRGFLGLKRFYLDRYVAIDGESYTRYMVENIEYMGEVDGELSDCIKNIDAIFTWQDNRTLKQVWDKDEGVIEWE